MATQFSLPSKPTFQPASTPELAAMQKSIEQAYDLLARRVENLITVDVIANRPAANGSFRFFFATDTGVLSFDDGAWNNV